MRQDKFSKAYLTLYACGVIPVVWLALLLAPYLSSGLVDLAVSYTHLTLPTILRV